MTKPHETFGRNVKEARRRLGLSQEALGQSCNLHRTEISLLERADREPRLGTIVKIAGGLGMTASQLLEGILLPAPTDPQVGSPERGGNAGAP